jgi:hypothetical protein
MSEIEFLTNYGHICKSKKVLYIGAADGFHLPFLCGLFPEYHFILYDPAQFDAGVFSISNAEVHNCMFEDGMTDIYAKDEVLFISDIRTVPAHLRDNKKNYYEENETDYDIEEDVKINMEQQKEWHLKLKPAASLMKFRLPYKPGKTEYLSGDLYYQVWAPSTSTECRLLVVGNEMKIYDHKDFESTLFRFNVCTRFQEFETPIRVGNFPHTYDIAGELVILANYLSVINGTDLDEIPTFLGRFEIELTKFFGKSIENKTGEHRRMINKIVEQKIRGRNIRERSENNSKEKNRFENKGL